ncbi:hypothetical protein ABI_15640 [Asticcacaulis biprosthecium C19]|uniref:Uncharacterized protein n=1 Tax=Asticcacaulis biprosthecium C19 TaxID=715226 RepID=F4QJE1_9CAUL|nr:hypothetical protein ABI_15640 [Asticcacaulis biprosthecium C19]
MNNLKAIFWFERMHNAARSRQTGEMRFGFFFRTTWREFGSPVTAA